MLPACVGLIPFGLVCGVGAASAGADWIAALGMSGIIFSGAAQILASQLLAAGAPLLVIVLTCFVAGLRFLMYSAAMAPHFKPLPSRWQQGLAFLMTDQVFAAAVRRFDSAAPPREAGLYFFGAGFALWLFWQITNFAGFLVGNRVPSSWSLDFAVPLCFIALVAPHLRSVQMIVAAVSAGVAVLALAGLPMRLNLIAAGVIGIAIATVADIAIERRRAK